MRMARARLKGRRVAKTAGYPWWSSEGDSRLPAARINQPMKLSRLRPFTKTAFLGSAVVSIANMGFAQDATKLDQLSKENENLRKRLEALEAMAQKEGLVASAKSPTMPVKALSESVLSGFVQASYFYDTSVPGDRKSNGYLWNTSHNAFSLNKIKLTLASPGVERSGDKWDAAYRVSLMFGEDAPIVNTGGEAQGLESVREAYIELNAPIGTGLNLRAGQLISLLNYESGDGGAANANFSQGYQWFYTGNGPSAGVQAGYTFTDWLDIKLRVQNGLYAGPFDGNNAKTVIGALGIKPDDKTWISLLGFGGDESSAFSILGGSILAGRTFGTKVTTGLEFDYFKFDNNGGTPDADLWSIGGWFGYDFTPKVGLALRAEYLSDPDGGGLRGISLGGRTGSALPPSADDKGEITSLALTLNIKPVPNVRLQPEIRFDNTSYKGAFDGQENRFMIGMGASYLF